MATQWIENTYIQEKNKNNSNSSRAIYLTLLADTFKLKQLVAI